MTREYYIVLDADKIDYGSVSDCCFMAGNALICECNVKKKLNDTSIRQVRLVGVIEFASEG